MRSFFAVSALLSLLAPAAHATLFEELAGGVPSGWTYSRTPKLDQRVKLRVALKQQNVQAFEQKVMSLSTPDHPTYGKHMSSTEIRDMLRPKQEATDAVMTWLQEANITKVVDDSDWIIFVTNVETANAILDTEFLWYRNEANGKESLRTTQYSVPKDVADHINLIQPTTRFPSMERFKKDSEILPEVADLGAVAKVAAASGAINPTCNRTITPQCLLQLYNVHYGADPKSGSKIGYGSFLEEYARYSDLDLFAANIAPYLIGRNFSVVTINGGKNDQTDTVDDSGEANLDNQYIFGVGNPNPVTEYSTGGRAPLVPDLDQPDPADNENEPYLEYFTALLKMPSNQLPQVVSQSYGEDEQSVPTSYVITVCNLIAQLGARGVSVIFSSGDSGPGSACLSNDGKNTTEFQPQFPAACPWVTSVGGTRYIDETATVFSSGGFSRVFSRPIYQELAVQGYLAQIGNTFSQYYNRYGRGFPDVAAQSYNYRVYNQGSNVGYQGTSCSAPTFSAIVSLLNAARLSKGLPTLGFLNPWLYSIGQLGLNDITKGGSKGCNGLGRFNGPPNGSPVIPGAGWNATKGWDPVTGLGTPNFDTLLKLAAPGVPNTGGPVPA